MGLLITGNRILLEDERKERYYILQWREIDAAEYLAEKRKDNPGTRTFVDPDKIGDLT